MAMSMILWGVDPTCLAGCAPKRKAIVIGEGMHRLKAFAAELEAKGIKTQTYGAPNMNRTTNPNPYGSAKSVDANRQWLKYWQKTKVLKYMILGNNPAGQHQAHTTRWKHATFFAGKKPVRLDL